MMKTFIAISLALGAAGASAQQTVNMPIVIELSGAGAVSGTNFRDGAVLAIEEINAAGGILGRKISAPQSDTQSNPGISRAQVQKALDSDPYVILPVARLLMRPDQAAQASGEGYLAAVMMHEISHGLGPAFARKGGKQVDIREAIGPAYSGLEEAKADVTGMFGLKWLVDQGALPKERLEEYYASYVAGIFRTVRFGTAEAHGRAEMMEFNYLAEKGAIVRESSGRYSIDYAMPGHDEEGNHYEGFSQDHQPWSCSPEHARQDALHRLQTYFEVMPHGTKQHIPLEA